MKKTTLLITLTLCLVAWTGAQANDRSFGDGTLPDHLVLFDADGDGTLSVEEVQAMRGIRHLRHHRWVEQWDTTEATTGYPDQLPDQVRILLTLREGEENSLTLTTQTPIHLRKALLFGRRSM